MGTALFYVDSHSELLDSNWVLEMRLLPVKTARRWSFLVGKEYKLLYNVVACRSYSGTKELVRVQPPSFTTTASSATSSFARCVRISGTRLSASTSLFRHCFPCRNSAHHNLIIPCCSCNVGCTPLRTTTMSEVLKMRAARHFGTPSRALVGVGIRYVGV